MTNNGNETTFRSFSNLFEGIHLFMSANNSEPISSVILSQKMLDLFENQIVHQLEYNFDYPDFTQVN